MDKATGGFSTGGNPNESAREAYGTLQKLWGVVGAWVMLIYIIPIFIINLILWAFVLLWTVPQKLWTVRFLPIFLIAGGVGLLLIQANQDSIVELSNVTTSCLDQIYAVFGKGIWDDMVRTLFPLCTLFNYFVQVMKYNIRTVTDEYRCFWTCDSTVCPCDTCNGGAECQCPKCEVSPANCVCDNDPVGCPSAGGFAIFTDCCACFLTAFEDLLLAAGFTLPEVVQIVTDLIDYLDIVPADPTLVSNFLTNFPDPGNVDWFWPGYRDTGSIPKVGSPGITREFHPARHLQTMVTAARPVLLERYINHTEGCALSGNSTKGKRCIPQNILDIMTPGTNGYSYLIFEIISQDFFGPFIELFMEVVLWLYHFLSQFFELGWDQVMSFLNDPSTTFQDMVQELFQCFTHEFLCFLLNWSGVLLDCCLALDFSGPVEFILSLLLTPCLGIPQDILDCLSSNDAFVQCIQDVIDGGSSVTDAATTLTTAATTILPVLSRSTEQSARYTATGGGGGRMVHRGGSGMPGGSTVAGAMTNSQGGRGGGGEGMSVLPKQASLENGGGYGVVRDANAKKIVHVFTKSRVEEIRGQKARRNLPPRTPDLRSQEQHLLTIYASKPLRAIHEKMLGMSMDVAYPNLHQRAIESLKDPIPVSCQPSSKRDVKPKTMWRTRTEGMFSKPTNGFSMFYGIGSLAESSVRQIMDFMGERIYDRVESYVSKIGIGEPSYFHSPSYSNATIQLLRNHAERMKIENPMSAYDAEIHEKHLQAAERKLIETQIRDQKRFGQLEPWMQLTHGQKALRYTTVWAKAIKEMLFFPQWNDETYDFDVPSGEDLRTEFDGRKIGSSFVRSITHWLSFLRQDNQQRDIELGQTDDDRPSTFINMEVTLKMMAWRFTSPWGLERLRDQLALRGPRWNAAARNVIDPAIKARDEDAIERQRRKEAFERGEKGALYQMPEINMALVLRWILEKASYRAATIQHRQQLAEALRSNNRTRYIQLKMYEEDMRNPITQRIEHIHRKPATGDRTKYNDTSRESYYAKHQRQFRQQIDPEESMRYMEERFGRQFDRILYQQEKGRSSWSYWISGRGKDLSTGPRTVDPQVVAFFQDHNQRLSRATTHEDVIRVYTETASRIPQLAAVGALVLPFIKNWRYVAGIAVPVLSSPYAQNIYQKYLDFFNSQIGNIVREPIADLVNSPGFLLQFSEDFAITTLETIDYVIAEIERTLLCLMPQILMQTMLSFLSLFAMLIPYVGQVLATILAYVNTIGSFFLPLVAVCPPEVQIDQQNFVNYLFDTLDCDSSITCITSDQCPGGAPCRCPPPTTQWTSLFWQFNGDYNQPCDGMYTGHCLCFWEFPCDFVFPSLTLNTFFDHDCSTFGYETDAKIVPWYPGNKNMFGSFSNFYDYVKIWVESGVVWLQYISRSIVRGYEPYFSMSTFIFIAAFGVGFAVTFGRFTWVFGVIILMFGIAYGSPLLTSFVGVAVIPAIERVGSTFGFLSTITDWLLEFLRWSNYSSVDPIGSPDPNELTCFVLNSGTGLTCVGIVALTALLINVLIQQGILSNVWLLIWYFILLLPRTGWRAIELLIFMSDQEGGGGGYEGGGYGGGGYGGMMYHPEMDVMYGGPQDIETQTFYDRYMVYDNDGTIRNVPVGQLLRDIPEHARTIGRRVKNYHRKSYDWKEWKIESHRLPAIPASIKKRLPNIIPKKAQPVVDFLFIHKQPPMIRRGRERPRTRTRTTHLKYG
jgi:hypothetical protein